MAKGAVSCAANITNFIYFGNLCHLFAIGKFFRLLVEDGQRTRRMIHVIWVDKQQGARNGMKVEERFAVSLPKCGDTTAVNAVKQKIRSDLTVMDLSLFDESVLGYQTSRNRSRPDPNFVSKWVPTVSTLSRSTALGLPIALTLPSE